MNTASLLNEYSDLLAKIDDDNIEDPDFRNFVRESAHDLEPSTLDDVVDEKIKELSGYLDEYRDTYRNKTACSVAERGNIIGKMRIAIEKVDLSLSVDAEDFYQMYSEYKALNDCSCKTCTVCGSRNPAEKLNDAERFLEVLEVSKEEVDAFNGLLYKADGVEDEVGR